MAYYGRDDRYDDYGGGERWDRERFERVRAKSRGAPRYETVRVQEEYPRGGEDRVRVTIDEDRRAPRPYSPPRRRRPEYVEQERIQNTGREVLPYREINYEPPVRRPQRPQYVRRPSSLDTFDRRPLPRYAEEERDVKVSINVRPPLPKPESRYVDREYRYKEPEPVLEFRREREVTRGPGGVLEESSDSFEEIEAPRKRRGKTRMPKRLVHKAALIQLGYPFEEEDVFYFVRMALEKDQIDEVVKLSESYFDDNKTVYKFEETKLLEAPAPPQTSRGDPEEEDVEIIETVTRKIVENPTASDFGDVEPEQRSSKRNIARSVAASIKSPSPTRGGRRGRSRSRPRGTEIFEEKEVEEDSSLGGGLVVLPQRRKSRRDRDIKAEIRALEAEKRALKYDQEAIEKREKADRIREGEGEILEGRGGGSGGGPVRVEKDRRGRLALVRHNN